MNRIGETVLNYAKAAALAVLALYLLTALLKNSGQSAEWWYWPGVEPSRLPVTVLALTMFLLGALAVLVSGATAGTVISFRRNRKRKLEERRVQRAADIQRKAAMLRRRT